MRRRARVEKMRPKRSGLDWALEAVALAALLTMLVLLAVHWEHLPLRPARMRYPGSPRSWSVRAALGLMGALGVISYLGMTLAIHFEKLIHIPEALGRAAPHLRQMMFRMGILLKAVLMAVSLYFVWVLVNLAQGRRAGFGPGHITAVALVVLIPLVLYTVKLWRAR